jgi:hypothetical protein
MVAAAAAAAAPYSLWKELHISAYINLKVPHQGHVGNC